MADILRYIYSDCCMWLAGYAATKLDRNFEDCMRAACLTLPVGRPDDDDSPQGLE